MMLLAMILLAAPLPTAPPKTWARDGYLQFKWGMGPGDVQNALHANDAQLRTEYDLKRTDDEVRDEFEVNTSACEFKIADKLIHTAKFSFVDQKLYMITLEPFVPDGAGFGWVRSVSDLLTKKYGKPVDASSENWIAGDVSISVFATDVGAMLFYEYLPLDARATEVHRHRARLREQAETKKLKPELDKL